MLFTIFLLILTLHIYRYVTSYNKHTENTLVQSIAISCCEVFDIMSIVILIKEVIFKYVLVFSSAMPFMMVLTVGTYFTFINKKIIEQSNFSIYNSVIYTYIMLCLYAYYLKVSLYAYTALFAYNFLLNYVNMFTLTFRHINVYNHSVSKYLSLIINIIAYVLVNAIVTHAASVCICLFIGILLCNSLYLFYKNESAFIIPVNDVFNMLKDIMFVSLFYNVYICTDCVNIFTDSYTFMIRVLTSVTSIFTKYILVKAYIDIQQNNINNNIIRASLITLSHIILCITIFWIKGVFNMLPMTLILSAILGSFIYTFTKVYCIYTRYYAHMVHAYNAFLFMSYIAILTAIRFFVHVNVIERVSLYTVCWAWNIAYMLNFAIIYVYIKYMCKRSIIYNEKIDRSVLSYIVYNDCSDIVLHIT